MKGSDNDNNAKESLSLENTLWSNTVLASAGYILAIVMYTGIETRYKMNSQHATTKIGKIDMEINRLAKLLFAFMVALSIILVGLNEF